jgi:hypothetical protein
MYFPTEMRGTKVIGEFIDEMTMAMITGFKSKHDDALDTISMLAYLKAWKPSSDTKMVESSDDDGVWDLNDGFEDEELSGLSAYLG